MFEGFCYLGNNLPSCFPIQFLEQLLEFLVNFTLLKYVKSQRNYGFFNHKRADFWLPNFGFKRSLLSLLNPILPVLLNTFQIRGGGRILLILFTYFLLIVSSIILKQKIQFLLLNNYIMLLLRV